MNNFQKAAQRCIAAGMPIQTVDAYINQDEEMSEEHAPLDIGTLWWRARWRLFSTKHDDVMVSAFVITEQMAENASVEVCEHMLKRHNEKFMQQFLKAQR